MQPQTEILDSACLEKKICHAIKIAAGRKRQSFIEVFNGCDAQDFAEAVMGVLEESGDLKTPQP